MGRTWRFLKSEWSRLNTRRREPLREKTPLKEPDLLSNSSTQAGTSMPTEVPATGETPESWPVLSVLERRILGVMVEKAKTTPDAYPMSVNAVVTGCNQKSNREPVMNVDDADVDEALAGM